MAGGYIFIEATGFTRAVADYFDGDTGYAEFQGHLVKAPTSGDVMPGVAPLRKIRWKHPKRGKGKRGGIRVIYLCVEEVRVLFMLDVYDKDEADDLTSEEKKAYRAVALRLEAELKSRFRSEKNR